MRMMRVVMCVCGFLFLSIPAKALEPASAFEDAFIVPSEISAADAVYSYPGMEAYAPSIYAAGAYCVPFGMDDLAVSTGYAGVSTRSIAGFASFSGSGFDLYGEEHAKLGGAYRPLPFLSCGFRATRSAMRIKGFGDASAYSADIGAVIHPHERLFAAISVEDIAGAQLGESKEPLDGRSRCAVSWLTPADVTVFAAVSKVRRFDADLTAGFVAEVTKAFFFGLAGGGEPDRIEYICAVRVKQTRFTYRGRYHSALGTTHGFSLLWNR